MALMLRGVGAGKLGIGGLRTGSGVDVNQIDPRARR